MEWLEQPCYVCVPSFNGLTLISVYEEVTVFIGQSFDGNNCFYLPHVYILNLEKALTATLSTEYNALSVAVEIRIIYFTFEDSSTSASLPVCEVGACM